MGEISIDPKFNIHETYKKVRILNPYRDGGSAENPIYNNVKECYSLRRIKASGVYSVRISRGSDSFETDVILPSNYTDFISLNSEVSAGGTLGNWIGSSDAIIKKFYGQKGFKDLFYANAIFKLIVAGVLQTLNGKPAFVTITTEGFGLEALGINGGVAIQNASLFGVYEDLGTINTNRAFGFGNFIVDGLGTEKRHWNIAADNSLRFDGGALTNSTISSSIGIKLRTTIKNGDSYSDFIKGIQNIAPTVLTGTNIKDDLYIGTHNSRNFKFSELIVFLTDESANRTAIETEINSVYNIF